MVEVCRDSEGGGEEVASSEMALSSKGVITTTSSVPITKSMSTTTLYLQS